MRTIDARLLVRGSHEPDAALEQLLTGALRVHAVVELRPNADGALVPATPVHRHRDARHYAVAATWIGRRLEPPDASTTADLARRLARVRWLCATALGSTLYDGVDLARDVLAALNGEA